MLYPIMRLKFHVTAFFIVTGTDIGEDLECYVKQDLCFSLRGTVKGDIEGIFLNVLLTKTKTVFAGII